MRRLAIATACLLLLGSKYAAAQAAETTLTAGVATLDITPEPGQRLWGYSNRKHPATGTLDPLMAKALVLRAGDETAAIVTLDLGRTPQDPLLARIREQTKQGCGIENLFITASHTHSAPNMEATPSRPNPYAEKVSEQIANLVCQAASKLEPVRIGVSHGEADFAHNRRKLLPDGRVAMQWRNAQREPTGPVDKRFGVIRLDRADGTSLAILCHYACHPVVLGPDNYEYSADFVGAACATVQNTLGAPCLYLQGACGDINPYLDKTPLDQGGVKEMRAMGRGLGELVATAAGKTTTAAPEHPSIQFEARTIPVRVRWDIDDPEVRGVLSKMYGARFDEVIAPEIKDNIVRCTLTTLLIDGNLALVGMPGEIFVHFQTALKNRSPMPNTFLVGYTNGYHAYFPTLRDAAAGGYGGKTATYVEPGAGERLTDQGLITLYKMTDQLHDAPRAEDFRLLEYDEIRDKSAVPN